MSDPDIRPAAIARNATTTTKLADRARLPALRGRDLALRPRVC